MTGTSKKHDEQNHVTKPLVVTDLVDPRPRRLGRFLNDYTLLSTTASSSPRYAGEPQVPSGTPEVHIQINRLPHKTLKAPLDVLVEHDDDGFLARTPDLPLYGYGEDRIEAVDMLKQEITSLYDELLENDHFSDEWLDVKRFLTERIESDE
jgi:hypothetical protein